MPVLAAKNTPHVACILDYIPTIPVVRNTGFSCHLKRDYVGQIKCNFLGGKSALLLELPRLDTKLSRLIQLGLGIFKLYIKH